MPHSWRTAAILLLLAVAAHALEERSIDHFAGVGARAMGLGGAYTGVADDFTAMYWNPAGLAQIHSYQILTTIQRGSRTTDATGTEPGASGSASAGRVSTSLNHTRFSTFGLVLPYPVYRGSLVLAAGWMRIKDFDWSLRQQGWDASAQLHTDFQFQHRGGVTLAGVAAAVDVSPALSLGMTVGFTRGEDESTSDFTWVDTQDLYLERRWLARESFDDEYRANWHAVLGAMLRAPRRDPRVRLGATVAAGTTRRIDYTFRGLSDVSGYDLIEYDDGVKRYNVVAAADGSLRPVQREEWSDRYRLSLPLEFSAGASCVPVSGLLLAAGVHFAEWRETQYEGRDTHDLRDNEDFHTQYRNTTRYHLGAEWAVPVIALDLRLGYYTDPLPFVGPRDPDLEVDAVANPEICIDQDRRYFTLGMGLVIDRVMHVDLSWTRGRFEQTEGELTEHHAISRFVGAVGYAF